MKTPNLLRYAAMLPLIAILFTACSKDSLQEPGKSNKTALQRDSDPVDADVYGALQATVYPPDANASVFVYNSSFFSDEYFTNFDGSIRIDKLVPGTYSVWFHSNNPDYIDTQIDNVRIVQDVVNDLGIVRMLINPMLDADR